MEVVAQGIQVFIPPLLIRLLALADAKHPLIAMSEGELEVVDLLFLSVEDYQTCRYSCTPENSLMFARTGMDGEHFSFLVQEEAVDEQSPVIFTAPANFGGPYNVIVAENFCMFIGLLLRYGGFALGELAFNTQEAVSALSEPLESSRALNVRRYDYDTPDDKKQALEFVANKLQIQPYTYAPSEFEQLQARYMHRLIMPPDYEAD